MEAQYKRHGTDMPNTYYERAPGNSQIPSLLWLAGLAIGRQIEFDAQHGYHHEEDRKKHDEPDSQSMRNAQKILELARNVNYRHKELVAVIEEDRTMTMKNLKIINSPYYRLPCTVISIRQAVVYLGINTIKNMALTLSAKNNWRITE